MGCYRNFIKEEKIGKKINDEITVVSKLINNNKPIEEVPSWEEKNNVPKEQIVVMELVNIARGVFDLNTSFRLPISNNLVIRYIG